MPKIYGHKRTGKLIEAKQLWGFSKVLLEELEIEDLLPKSQYSSQKYNLYRKYNKNTGTYDFIRAVGAKQNFELQHRGWELIKKKGNGITSDFRFSEEVLSMYKEMVQKQELDFHLMQQKELELLEEKQQEEEVRKQLEDREFEDTYFEVEDE